MSQGSRNKPHFFLGSTGKPEFFTSRPAGGGQKPTLPELDRLTHGQKLRGDLAEIKNASDSLKDSVNVDDITGPIGILIEFKSQPNIDLAFESLANEKSKDGSKNIEVLNLIQHEDKTMATIFVPDGEIHVLEKKIADYLESKTNSAGRPLDNKALINTIESIRIASLEALWTDSPDVFPSNDNEELWWEVWLPVRGNRQAIIEDFTKFSSAAGISVSEAALEFPERTVVLAKGSKAQLSSSPLILNNIAELRLAKETAEFFDDLQRTEQHEWANELLDRTTLSDDSNVRICILDTGVNSGHPLLSPFIAEDDTYTVEPEWDTADENGHGTEMAGLAVWGDLTNALESTESHKISHSLESVKLLRYGGDNNGKHLGQLTSQGASLPIISAPHAKRIYSMALSATDTRDRGRPSAWSSALDSLAVDYVNEGEAPNLFVVSAGNVTPDLEAMRTYPEFNLLESIHDPAQAWNVLTAGAYTEKTNIIEPNSDYRILAPEGGLSPFSTTTVSWHKQSPIKPELVLEGGNAASDELAAVDMASLSLLTTNSNITERLLTTTRATSASTALLANMAASIMVEYPNLWPETVRALLVHSAQWTNALKAQFNHGNTERQKHAYLLRCCGYGVPSLSRALNSASNSLTMVIEDSLQPFYKEKGVGIKTRDMHLHELTWPKEALQELGEAPVILTATLSYFIEPNPSARGVKGRYNYQSHGLRFDVKRPLETRDQFRARINDRVNREEDGSSIGGGDPQWLIGANERHRGSIHKDIWTGTAAELSERGYIAIYPAMGWWRTRQKLERFESEARYSLVVTIETPESDTDIYSIVKAQIELPTEITV